MSTPELPAELVSAIAENLSGDFDALLVVSLLCRRWRDASNHVLFTKVTIESSRRLDLFLDLIREKPQICRWVRHLQLGRFHTSARNAVNPTWFLPATRFLHNRFPVLKTLRICNLDFYDVVNAASAFNNIASGFASLELLEFTVCKIHPELVGGLVSRLGNLQRLSIGYCWKPVGNHDFFQLWDVALDTTKRPRIKRVDIQWTYLGLDIAKILLVLAESGCTDFTESIFISSAFGSPVAMGLVGRALKCMPRLEEFNLKVGEEIDEVGMVVPEELSLRDHKYLRRLNLEVPSLVDVRSIVQTLNPAKLPILAIGVKDQVDFQEFASPEVCMDIERLIVECGQGPRLIARLKVDCPETTRSLQNLFPVLHSKGQLQVEIGPGPSFAEH